MLRIDSHCHIYPDAIAARAVAGTGRFYDLPLVYAGTLADLTEQQKKHGIDGGVVFSVATTPHQVAGINRFIAECVRASAGRLVGLGTVHPDSPTLAEDIESILSLGLCGVKLHPDIQGFKMDDYRCLRIYELCEGRLPIMMHCGDSRYDLSNPNRLAPILSIFTGLTVIGAHFGGWSVWEEAQRLLCDYPNFYVDTSSSLYALTPARGRELVRHFGAERVLFATDYPMWSLSDELERFAALGLSPEEQEKIFYRNAMRLFPFPALADRADK